MKIFNNLKIGVKLTGGFLFIALIVVAVAVVGYSNMKNIDENMHSLYFDRMKPIHQLGAAEASLYSMRGDIYKYILVPEERTKSSQAIDASIQIVNEEMDKYRVTFLVSEEKVALAEFDKAWPDYQKAIEKVLVDIDAGNQTQAIRSLQDGEAHKNRQVVADGIDELLATNVRVADEVNTQGDMTFASSGAILGIVTLFGLLLAIGLGLFLSRSLSNAAKLMVKTAGQISQTDLPAFAVVTAAIAGGDLTKSVSVQTQSVDYDSKDEMGDLARAFNVMITRLQDVGTNFTQMTANLNDLVRQVAENAYGLSAASEQLAASAQQSGQAAGQITATIQEVGKGISQQSESISHTASSVEQMSRVIEGVAKGAQNQAKEVENASVVTSQLSTVIQEVSANAETQAKGAAEAVTIARSSSQTVEETILGMQRIQSKVNLTAEKVREMGQRSDQIGLIVETIDDIASQTNLLALNAAIDAARAGEHGKGFAVVADEVRKLAEKSAGATKEIGGLVKGIQSTVSEAVQAMKDSAGEVESGVTLANQSGHALVGILDAAVSGQQSGEMIAAAATRMSSLASELANAMLSVSAVVEENTVATEEMAARSSDVTRAIENIASVSEENSAATEEVSASTEEMSAQVEEVTASAQSLAEMAQTLQQFVARFKLDGSQTSSQVPAPVTQRSLQPVGVGGHLRSSGSNGHRALVGGNGNNRHHESEKHKITVGGL